MRHRHFCVKCQEEFFVEELNMNARCPKCGEIGKMDWLWPSNETA